MGNQSPSTPKKRLHYLKNNPPNSQTTSQNRSFENLPVNQNPNKKTTMKSVSPIRNNEFAQTVPYQEKNPTTPKEKPKNIKSKKVLCNLFVNI